MSDITEHPDPRDADLVRRLTNRLADGITSVTLDSSTTPPTVSFTPDESLMAEALADLSRLREERDALTHDRDQARDEADNWRQQAWMEGYPRDSGDRHPWETSDEYRDLLAAGWASPTPRISPEATS